MPLKSTANNNDNIFEEKKKNVTESLLQMGRRFPLSTQHRVLFLNILAALQVGPSMTSIKMVGYLLRQKLN